MQNKFLLVFFMLLACSGRVLAVENSEEAKITSLLQKWPQDFNAKDIRATCGLFAPDLVATYPGAPDRNYEEMCRHITEALTSTNRTFLYEAPLIEQIMIEGDLAVVRLIWTLKITTPNRNPEMIKERGLDVFRRQKDGSWKIAISFAYEASKK